MPTPHFSSCSSLTPMNSDLKEKEQFKSLPEDEFKDADAYEVVNKLFRAFTQRKITTPGSFKSHSGASAVKCAFKANDGYVLLSSSLAVYFPSTALSHLLPLSFSSTPFSLKYRYLYLLERSFFFVHKPPLYP